MYKLVLLFAILTAIKEQMSKVHQYLSAKTADNHKDLTFKYSLCYLNLSSDYQQKRIYFIKLSCLYNQWYFANLQNISQTIRRHRISINI